MLPLLLVGSEINSVLWFSLAGCQVPTKATPHSLSSTGQGRENMMKGSWVEIRTGRDLSPVSIMGEKHSTWGN